MSAEVNEKRGRRRRQTDEEILADDHEIEDAEDKGIVAAKGRPTVGRRNKQVEETSGNPITRFFGGVVEYFQGVQSELEKVSWPTREDVIRLTRIVLSVTILASIALGIIAYGFTVLFSEGLRNPIIFVIFFAVVGVIAFFVTRRTRSDSAASSFNSRL